MNGFWKKKLPAFALALIMLVGLMPSALAAVVVPSPPPGHEGHTCVLVSLGSPGGKDTIQCQTCNITDKFVHESDGLEDQETKHATCYQEGSRSFKCKYCAQTITVTIPMTGHNYDTKWTKDATSHWHACKTPGCTARGDVVEHTPKSAGAITKPTCTAGGYVTYECGVCGERYREETSPALGHDYGTNGRCTRCSATHTHKDDNQDGLCDLCGYRMSASTFTVTFYTGSGTSSQSVARGGYPNVSTPSMPSVPGSHVFQGWVSGKASYFGYTGQSMVSPGTTAVTGNLNYSAVYKLRATGQNADFSAGTTGGKLIGDSVRTQVAAKFYALTGRNSFSTIQFQSIGGSGNLYANSSKDKLTNTSYTYTNLDKYLYFVPSTSGALALNYTATDNYDNQISGTLTISGKATNASDIIYRVAPNSTVNFKVSSFEEAYRVLANDSTSVRYVDFYPDKSYDSFAGSLYLDGRSMDRDRVMEWTYYTARERDGDKPLSSVNFRADKNAKEGAELVIPYRVYYNESNHYDGNLHIVIDKDGQEGDVVYRVAPGGTVTFNRSDFNKAYQDLTGSSRKIDYVEFDPDNDYTTFSGKISVSGHADFNQRDLSREQFYYSSSNNNDYVIDDLIFRASSSSRDGDTLEIPFRAFYSRDDYADGTLHILIDKYGSQDTVTCNVAPGGTTRLDKTDFNEVYRALADQKNRTISAVSFSAPDSYRNFDGALYVRNSALELSDLTHSKTWFYYSNSKEGDYALDDLNFQASRSAREGDSLTIPFRAYYNNDEDEYEEGTLRIHVTSEVNTITYEAAPGGSMAFRIEDFNRAYQTQSGNSGRTIQYVTFEANSDYASFAGGIYTGSTLLSRNNLTHTQTQFYYNTPAYGTYALSTLSFRADAGARDGSSISVPFRAYYSSSDYEDGTLKLVVNASANGDVSYTVTPGRTVNFDRVKFDDFYRKTYSGDNLDYIVFNAPSVNDFPDNYGTIYTGYNTSYSTSFSRSNLHRPRFYYNAGDAGRDDYAINDMTFAAASSFVTGKVVLRFTAYGSNSRSVDGTLVITPTTAANNTTSNLQGSVRYAVTSGTNVQINANDLARFYKASYPSGSLQYVVLNDVPSTGALYYNYYGASKYGTATREQITASNRGRNFYQSPATTSEYALTELTYVPSGANYCASIPFTAYGTGGQSVTGAILISVTSKAVSEVYGPTPKGTAVTFPASSIYAAVSAATSTAPVGFQLLKLPAANVGVVYVGSTNTPANTTTVYGYNTGTQQLGQLRFVPAANYTGPVEIPYVALNASNVPIASGVFSMGVLNSRKEFKDVTASTWCYKYVVELADASVIDGYANGNFGPDNTITYGAALKLIMKAAGYGDQAPTVPGSTFSGYLAKAQADGLITRTNVNLSGPITRLQVAQLAAGALKLDINNLSSVKPFTDTADVYVQALNAAGIVEGYFNNGTSTFRPSNTLTRGQVSAIVWRMQNYRR